MYESFNEIDSICGKYKIKNYTINIDGSIDVDGDVDFFNFILIKLPLSFGKVSGDFYCGFNQLTSLDGCPRHVGGDFSCRDNCLKSLKGCPKEVVGNFSCSDNQLTSLEGGPSVVGVSVYFDCSYNELTSLEGCPKIVSGYFDCGNNKLTSLEGCPKHVSSDFFCGGNPIHVVYQLIEDIVRKDYYKLIEFVENWNPIRPGNIIILDRLNDYLETFGGKPVTSVKGYKCI